MAMLFRVCNVALVLLALLLLAGLIDAFRQEGTPAGDPESASRERRAAVQAPPAGAASPLAKPAAPPLSEFAILLEKEAFKSPSPEPAASAPPAAKPAPPPPPLPALMGTIFIEEERRAVLKDQHRAEYYTVGQAVAGGTLVQIETDHVVIERNGARSEVPLQAAIRAAQPAGPAGGARARGPGEPAAGGAPPAASPGGADAAEPVPTVRAPRTRHFPASAKQAREDRLRSELERRP